MLHFSGSVRFVLLVSSCFLLLLDSCFALLYHLIGNLFVGAQPTQKSGSIQ